MNNHSTNNKSKEIKSSNYFDKRVEEEDEPRGRARSHRSSRDDQDNDSDHDQDEEGDHFTHEGMAQGDGSG